MEVNGSKNTFVIITFLFLYNFWMLLAVIKFMTNSEKLSPTKIPLSVLL